MLIIDIEELGRVERFEATLDGRVLCRSRQPLLASARVLMAKGVAPETVIGMRRLGCEQIDLTGVLGECAELTVADPARGGAPRFAVYSVPPAARGRPPAAEDDLGDG
jgi:hypothetical protein